MHHTSKCKKQCPYVSSTPVQSDTLNSKPDQATALLQHAHTSNAGQWSCMWSFVVQSNTIVSKHDQNKSSVANYFKCRGNAAFSNSGCQDVCLDCLCCLLCCRLQCILCSKLCSFIIYDSKSLFSLSEGSTLWLSAVSWGHMRTKCCI